MTPTDKQLEARQSFNALKTNARSGTDVAAWFAMHPDCIPGLPDAYKPFVKVTCASERVYEDPNMEPPGIVNWMTLHYEAEIPNVKDGAINDHAFEAITGQTINISHTQEMNSYVRGELTMPLAALQWQYVTTIAAFKALDSTRLLSDTYRAFIKEAWEKTFPQVAWEQVQALHSTGLLEGDAHHFSAWAFNTSQEEKPATDLPIDLTA